MPNLQYPLKDRMVKIYRQKTVRWRNESASGQYFEKHYIHPRADYIRAYVRQIVASTTDTDPAEIPSDRYLVVINYRDLGDGEKYVEWNGRTLKILFSDGYEHRPGEELKLTCQLIPEDGQAYKRVSDEPWPEA